MNRIRNSGPQLLLVVGVGLGSWACASTSPDESATTSLTSIVAAEPSQAVATTTRAAAPPTIGPTAPPSSTATSSVTSEATIAVQDELVIDASDFKALADMTPVRGFFVDNLLGDLDSTIAVAESSVGGVYPIGSVVQLIPGEVMVKREIGFSPTTKDWEFFELDVDTTGSTIRVRGGDEVINRFGGSCATCHELAEPQWDFVCEQDHGCEALPIDRATIESIQQSDPRPRGTSSAAQS
jgi:hypothetical protein